MLKSKKTTLTYTKINRERRTTAFPAYKCLLACKLNVSRKQNYSQITVRCVI